MQPRRRRLHRLACAAVAVLIAAGPGCGPAQSRAERLPVPSPPAGPAPVVAALRNEVQPELDRRVADQQEGARRALAAGSAVPARHKRAMVVEALADPWAGLVALENWGLRLAALAEAGPSALPRLLAALESGRDRPSAGRPAAEEDDVTSPAELESFLVRTLEEAGRRRARALRRLAPADRAFLFDQAAVVVRDFYPHVERTEGAGWAGVPAGERFGRLVAEELDVAELVAAAQVLARLVEAPRPAALARALQDRPVSPVPVGGVSGDLLLVRETEVGLLVVGGPGPNRYDLDGRIALLIDVGGADVYRGAVASTTAPGGLGVVMDLGGDDVYESDPLGLATGRVGVGLLVDLAGDDRYRLAPGAGGVGLAGVGLLLDLAGNDRYEGSRFTQGAAVGGIGLLLDSAGRDVYEGWGYALGFGGPLGVGALIDAAGDDDYRCGGRLPSAYNEAEAPGVAPDDPRFQYDCLGLGTGAGTRVHVPQPEPRGRSLAGGVGLLLDLSGNDRYRGANFSLGAGYFFGAGLALDLAGDDEREVARYGLAAGAHQALGLFVDYGGRDLYRSTGPVYDGGAAWDGSVMLAVDAGPEDDRYELERAGGLGQADLRAWGLFIEQGGRDRYATPIGMGWASPGGLGAFFDLAGEDDYLRVPASPRGPRGNGMTLSEEPAGLFLDRAGPGRP